MTAVYLFWLAILVILVLWADHEYRAAVAQESRRSPLAVATWEAEVPRCYVCAGRLGAVADYVLVNGAARAVCLDCGAVMRTRAVA